MAESQAYNQELLTRLELLADEGIQNAARGFSSLVGQHIQVNRPSVRMVPLLDLPKIAGGLENEAIGIYLCSEGAIPGQFMLIVPYQKALELVDLMMDVPTGTSQTLGSLERSALGEIGNLTASFFLNSLASHTGLSVRPTPPAVMVDMIGAILDILVATAENLSDRVLLMKADFLNGIGDRSVSTEFWMIPDLEALHSLKIEGLKVDGGLNEITGLMACENLKDSDERTD